jgi:membrane-associated phospholipid phosphatase
MVAISAITSAFWLLYPQSRWICAICIATVFVGQLGANYHFVSDVIAGGFVGFSVGLMIIYLWKCSAPLKSSPENKHSRSARRFVDIQSRQRTEFAEAGASLSTPPAHHHIIDGTQHAD